MMMTLLATCRDHVPGVAFRPGERYWITVGSDGIFRVRGRQAPDGSVMPSHGHTNGHIRTWNLTYPSLVTFLAHWRVDHIGPELPDPGTLITDGESPEDQLDEPGGAGPNR